MKYAVGEMVAVCHDGVWSRAVDGKIVGVGGGVDADNPGWIKVRFIPWNGEGCGFVEMTAGAGRTILDDTVCYGGWLIGAGGDGIMRSTGSRGDRYSVWSPEELAESGYMTEPYERQPREDQ